jgi:F-type H+-transporting ATPase subunit delta
LNRHRGIEEAEVRTAVPIDEDEKEKVARYLESMTGKKIIIKTIVDTDVIGGVVVRAGGKLLDASTRSRLLKLKRELSGAS